MCKDEWLLTGLGTSGLGIIEIRYSKVCWTSETD